MEKDLECCSYQLIKSSNYIIYCPICYNESHNNFVAYCKHSWCMKCHFQLKSNNCPLCRKKFNKKNNYDKNPQIKLKNKLIDQIKKRKTKYNKKYCCFF